MSKLDSAVLATVIYYDVLDFPLTALEVFNFLINPARFTKVIHIQGLTLDVDNFGELTELADSLDELVKAGEIEEKMGFYFLPGRSKLCLERLEKNKITEEKWKKARRYLFLAQAVPYLEAIFASGSLALGHTDKESDLDVLVVAKSGHIWLVRLLLSLLMSFLRVRRKNKERFAPDKICLNHYITTDSLEIPFASLYNAQTYAHLIPIYWRDGKTIELFWKKNNQWIQKFLCRWELPDSYQKRVIGCSKLLRQFRLFLEKVLEQTKLDCLFEKLFRKIQLERININLPGRVIANDRQLEFHPYSAEKDILRKYNRAAAAWPIFDGYGETDSGLR